MIQSEASPVFTSYAWILPVSVLASIFVVIGLFWLMSMRYTAELKPIVKSHRRRESVSERLRRRFTLWYFALRVPMYFD